MRAVAREFVDAYPVIRSTRRTVGITVKRGGEVTIRAPRGLPLSDVRAVVEKHRAWLERTVESSKRMPPLPDAREQACLRKEAERMIPALVDRWASIMGVQPTSVRITSAKTRFGSCSGKNRLCFSLFLLQYPPEAVEYVVVHELCHIRHHHHGAAFWALVGRWLPDYRARQALLKKQPERKEFPNGTPL